MEITVLSNEIFNRFISVWSKKNKGVIRNTWPPTMSKIITVSALFTEENSS